MSAYCFILPRRPSVVVGLLEHCVTNFLMRVQPCFRDCVTQSFHRSDVLEMITDFTIIFIFTTDVFTNSMIIIIINVISNIDIIIVVPFPPSFTLWYHCRGCGTCYQYENFYHHNWLELAEQIFREAYTDQYMKYSQLYTESWLIIHV